MLAGAVDDADVDGFNLAYAIIPGSFLYLAGGRLGFEEGRMGVDQVLAVKPAAGR
jgi:hypothetical protein